MSLQTAPSIGKLYSHATFPCNQVTRFELQHPAGVPFIQLVVKVDSPKPELYSTDVIGVFRAVRALYDRMLGNAIHYAMPEGDRREITQASVSIRHSGHTRL